MTVEESKWAPSTGSAGSPLASSGTGLRIHSPVIPANAGIHRNKLQRMNPPRIRKDDIGPGPLRQAQGPGFLPTVSELVELAVRSWQGLEKKKITTIKHERTRSDSFFFRAFPCNSVANAFLCSSSVSVVNCLTLVELLDTALAHPFQHIEITLGI